MPARREPTGEHDLWRMFTEYVTSRTGKKSRYESKAAKWRLVYLLADVKDVVLPGANSSLMHTLKPRQANDVSKFGARDAIYAASDGIWPI